MEADDNIDVLDNDDNAAELLPLYTESLHSVVFSLTPSKREKRLLATLYYIRLLFHLLTLTVKRKLQ